MSSTTHTPGPHVSTENERGNEFEAVIVVTGRANGALAALIDSWDINTLSFARALRDDLGASGVCFRAYAKLGQRDAVLLAEVSE